MTLSTAPDPKLARFQDIWALRFETRKPDQPGDPIEPLYAVAINLSTGEFVRLWDDFDQLPSFGPGDLFVGWETQKHLGCMLALGLPLPQHILDLRVEFRCQTNGKIEPGIATHFRTALTHHEIQLSPIQQEPDPKYSRRSGNFTDAQRQTFLDRCEAEVSSSLDLLTSMLPATDINQALQRGSYMAAVAHIERTGTPIDTKIYTPLKASWKSIKTALIEKVDKGYGVFTDGKLDATMLAKYLKTHDIKWPLNGTELDLDDDVFKAMAANNSVLEDLWQLQKTLKYAKSWELTIGSDGRNRCPLNPFGARTARNTPSNKQIFGLPSWFRNLIKPETGKVLVYIDYAQQEFGIAAALSQDQAMMNAYRSKDAYLAFAEIVGIKPTPEIRDQFKLCALRVQNGGGAQSIAKALGIPQEHAKVLLAKHEAAFPVFWQWQNKIIKLARSEGFLETQFGWRMTVKEDTWKSKIANFPLQSTGTEILQRACVMMIKSGIRVCAPVHDAVLIEADKGDINRVVEEAQQIMAQAAAEVLGGFELRTDAKIYKKRFEDDRGKEMWDFVQQHLEPGPPTPTTDNRYVKGPVPWEWICRASKLKGSALAVGIALFHLAGIQGPQDILLGKKLAEELGMHWDTAKRGLKKLEKAGLVTVNVRSGSCPRVTIRHPKALRT